jgi:hypothetical protein
MNPDYDPDFLAYMLKTTQCDEDNECYEEEEDDDDEQEEDDEEEEEEERRDVGGSEFGNTKSIIEHGPNVGSTGRRKTIILQHYLNDYFQKEANSSN